MKQHEHLVFHFISRGYEISVYTGEKLLLSYSDNITKIVEEIEHTKDCAINLFNEHGGVYSAFIHINNECDDPVYDYTDNRIMSSWANEWKKYEQLRES